MYDTTQISEKFYDMHRYQIKPEVKEYKFSIKIEEEIWAFVFNRIWRTIADLIDDQIRIDLKNV